MYTMLKELLSISNMIPICNTWINENNIVHIINIYIQISVS